MVLPPVVPPRVERLRVVVRRRAGAFRAGFFAAAADVFAAPVERFALVERFAAGLRAGDTRDAPPVAAFARVDVERAAVVRAPVARLRVPAALRVPVERFAAGFRPVVDREELDWDEPPDLDAVLLSSVHLPLITRCAASATASAISAPNFVALDIILLAAADALSAASRPASRIARRALGLALIAAAAAARPAANISLLIAALASLSTVALPDDPEERVDLEEVLREDLAIASISRFSRK